MAVIDKESIYIKFLLAVTSALTVAMDIDLRFQSKTDTIQLIYKGLINYHIVTIAAS